MGGQVTRTVQADNDLIAIWVYIARDNEEAADRLLDTIEAKAALLAGNPGIGPARDDIAPGLRFFQVGRYMLLYREVPEGIEIVRVIHGSRNLIDLL